MKKLQLTIIAILFISISCSPKIDYVPKHAEIWQQINDSIEHNWVHASGMCTPTLKDSFAYAFWCGLQFYWDTYYTQLGLLAQNNVRLAKGGANNLMYLADSLKFIPNANMDWGDNRSQPPYLSMMVRDLYPYLNDTAWLRKAYQSLLIEYNFWTDTSATAIENHNTSIPGLQRYSNHATRREHIIMYTTELVSRFGMNPTIDTAQMLLISDNFATEAATGMDFTPRFEHRCAEFAAVDLNSNLYIYEQNFAWIEKQLGISDGEKWEEKAQVRKDLINKYCWDESRGLYLDYDYINKRTSKVASVMTFAPLYANIASHQQAGQVVANMNLLESEWGLVTTEDAKEERIYQWDHVGVWAPMQSLTIIGLDNYGFKSDAKRVAMKYLDLVANNFISPNPAWYLNDKKDTIKRSKGLVFEKYTREGKINDREYKANTMMGWSAGTFAFAFAYLNKNK